MIELIIGLIVKIIMIPIMLVITALLMIFTFIIPNLIFDVSDLIPYIEEDIAIEIPEEYKVIYKSQDYLGFELHQEVELKYSRNDFETIISQVKDSNINWEKSGRKYSYENLIHTDSGDPSYFFDCILDIKKYTLNYNYHSF